VILVGWSDLGIDEHVFYQASDVNYEWHFGKESKWIYDDGDEDKASATLQQGR